jgi:hypothetical protein
MIKNTDILLQLYVILIGWDFKKGVTMIFMDPFVTKSSSKRHIISKRIKS